MKFLILTDIHGSIKYLNIAIQKFNQLGCGKILLLGDILYHGPRNDLPTEYKPKEVIALLNSYKDKIICVKGNCDAEVDEMVLEFPLHPVVALECNGFKLEMVHGHNIDETTGDGYIIHGHTHVNKIDGNIINIGSLSIPKDNHHTYAILEGNELTAFDLMTDEVIMKCNL